PRSLRAYPFWPAFLPVALQLAVGPPGPPCVPSGSGVAGLRRQSRRRRRNGTGGGLRGSWGRRRARGTLRLAALARGLLRSNHRRQIGPFLLWPSFEQSDFSNVLNQPLHHLPAEVAMGHLAPPEHDGRLYLIAVLQELENLIALHLKVVVTRAGTELHFFEFNRFLMFSGLVLPLVKLIEELAVIDDATDGWCGRGGNLHQVQPLAARDFEGLERRHDAELLALVVNHPDLFGPDPLINPNVPVSDKDSLPPTRPGTSWPGT